MLERIAKAKFYIFHWITPFFEKFEMSRKGKPGQHQNKVLITCQIYHNTICDNFANNWEKNKLLF